MDSITKADMHRRRCLMVQTSDLIGVRSNEDVVLSKPVTVAALGNCGHVRLSSYSV